MKYLSILLVFMASCGCYVETGDKDVYRDWGTNRKSTRLNSSHSGESRMPSSA